MTTVDTCQLTNVVDTLQQSAASALSTESAAEFERFERQLSDLAGLVRELQQAMWANEAQATLRRLERGEPLTETDTEVIRTFLVSDAEHYLAVENDFPQWLEELRRLMDDIRRRVENLDRTTIGELRGVLKDAIRLVPDIRNYLDEQQRVERCNVALHTFDKTSRAALARVLTEQLRKSDR